MFTTDSTSYIPLYDFSSTEELFEIAPGIRMQRFKSLPAINLSFLAKYEENSLHGVGQWLVFEPHSKSMPSISARMNNWALALWLVRLSKLTLRFRFEQSSDGKSHGFYRIFSSPMWNSEDVEPGPFTYEELLQAKTAFIVFETIPTDSRLGTALSLTAEANWQHRWHAGIALYSAALETLLTYERGYGLTARLAKAYGAVAAPSGADRSSLHAAFVAAYDARSGVMHGRSDLNDEGERLRALALWCGMTRDIWRRIVAEPALLIAMQSADSVRKAVLNAR